MPCAHLMQGERIGFDAATIKRLLSQYKPSLIQQWSDITLSAI